MIQRILRSLAGVAVTLALMAPVASPALAMTMAPSPELGQHVYQMAAVEQHPLLHGGLTFAECVAAMATGETCPHHTAS
ncbi:MAG: hypothetical protein ACYC4L_22280 [Chloroflexota bacterium]